MRQSSPSAPTYVYKNGFGRYYFRIAIPQKLRDIVKKYEIRRSLKTTNYSVAVRKARRLAVIAETLFQGGNVNEKELRDFLITSSQIKMAGPVRIGNGVLECGGIETDPNKHQEEMQMLQEIMEQVKSTAGSNDASVSINMLVEKLLESNPTSTEMLEVLQKLAGTVTSTAAISNRQTGDDQAAAMQLEELISKYSTVQIQEGNWTAKTTSENMAIFDLLKSYFGDTPVKDISHEDADQFRGILLKLPPNMNKNPLYRGKSVSIVINMKPVKTLSKASVNKYMRRISGMFNFAEERKYTTINPFRKKQIREDKQPDENRDILSGEDLSALFNPDRFYSKLDTPFKYWIPLIGLYTGARLNEIAEMDAADIVEEKGVWCFYFNTSKQKARRKRLIPVHSHLKKLGLLQYAHAQTGKLFPELRKRRDGYGQEVSRWYNQYRRECGLTEIRNGDFHCYRHTMSTALDKAGVRSKTISQIIGHSTGGPKQTTTERVYIKKDEIEIRAAAIEKLNYGEPVNNLEPYDILFPSASFESAICLTTRSTDDELL